MIKISAMLTLLLCFVAVLQVAATETGTLSTLELKSKADEVLQAPNVSTRRDVDVVFALIDRLLNEHQELSAENYLVKGLQHFPWNLKYQLIYAQLLDKKGEHDKAKDKATLVVEYGESDALIEPAKKILNKKIAAEFPVLKIIPGDKYCVVLVPMQECDKWLLARVEEKLEKILAIPVYIQAAKFDYPPPRRDRRQQAINQMRRKIYEDATNAEVVNGLKTLHLIKDDLKNDNNVLMLIKYLTPKSDADNLAALDAYLIESEGKDMQWNADELNKTLATNIASYRRKNVAYLGVTSVDMYANDYNFLFGWANIEGGVVSYRRFTAAFNNEIPNQDRLIKRTMMQCLASIGKIYGINSCTNPTCARAYPNSLAEHDAKDGALCSECKKNFKTVFEHQGSSRQL